MSMSLGGLGYVSLRNPFADLFAIVLGKGDLRSMFCLIVFLIVSLVLAYLTNPTENSFRAYLTEQSFRHHLSRLDESADDPHSSTSFRPRYASRNSTLSSAHNFQTDNTPPFHFANRASIALRTPKHVFHSFAIFTIAAMVPMSKASEGDNREGWMIADSWYIGAFGKWWRGGVLEAWYQDVISRSKDEESWSSGILSMKRLDMLQDYNGPTFTTKNLPANLRRGSPPRLRNRERPTLRHTSMQPRSSTPPPLPKSATLPMHATRKSSTNGDRISDRVLQTQQPQPHVQPSLPNDSARFGSSVPSRSSSTLFEHTPAIAELLRQITNSKASVVDLRTQLSECEAVASQSRTVLQHEVEIHRKRKRQEDASKLEIKARTKTLEDTKRSAEALKKEAEKKLKAAQSCHDSAVRRVEYLDKGIVDLQHSLSEDRSFNLHHQSQVSDVEREITENLDRKRQEIKHAEDLLVGLNQRSRELEEKLASEKERLRLLREESAELKQNSVSVRQYSPHNLHQHQPDTWSSNTQYRTGHFQLVGLQNEDSWAVDDVWNHAPSAIHGDIPYALDHKVNVPICSPNNVISRNPAIDYSPYNGNSFVPFADVTRDVHLNGKLNVNLIDSPELVRNPRAQDIPTNGLSAPIENSISRSFQSDSDPYIDKEWRNTASYPTHFQDDSPDSRFGATSSPTSVNLHSLKTPDDSSFDARFLPSHDYDRHVFDSPIDMQGPNWLSSDAASLMERQGADYNVLANLDKDKSQRWFPFGRERTKGLNPDAKEFNLFPKSSHNVFHSHAHLAPSTYDALNPNGLGTTLSSSASSNSQSLLRAFAPSPAEREALQRALGGSSNTSFERLPSLSDVGGSIPASPTAPHAHVHVHAPQHSGRALGGLLPAWLQSLPRARKVNFSPWEDEEPQQAEEVAKVNSSA
ncbi:hypothetical protein BDN70DRAFT_825485 [Pholiota conissans]|uniref:Uncharacterized protein n=1 Tax=Pholiota conissans TaxID=109636 RepID=A0A9P5ZDG2_9AGAR|nr:hypothetical protein BDN70DRAFT_825485 [Pholiota conissans]